MSKREAVSKKSLAKDFGTLGLLAEKPVLKRIATSRDSSSKVRVQVDRALDLMESLEAGLELASNLDADPEELLRRREESGERR